MQRACSLLEIVSDHRALEETDRVDGQLAMEVFAIREEIDDAETIDEVMPVQIEINQRYEDEQDQLSDLFVLNSWKDAIY